MIEGERSCGCLREQRLGPAASHSEGARLYLSTLARCAGLQRACTPCEGMLRFDACRLR